MKPLYGQGMGRGQRSRGAARGELTLGVCGSGLVTGQGLGVSDVVGGFVNQTLSDDRLAVFVVKALAVEDSLTVRIEERKGFL